MLGKKTRTSESNRGLPANGPKSDSRVSGATLRSLIPDSRLIEEILLVDDGSDDQTASIALDSAQRYGLPVEVVSVSLGSAGAARNIGIARARGKAIFFLDADDELIEGGLSLLHEALLQKGGSYSDLVRRQLSSLDGTFLDDTK